MIRGIGFFTVAIAIAASSGPSLADGIISTVVSSPLAPNGTVVGQCTGLNIYLQSVETQGVDFMDPAVIGYGLPAGGRLEVELLEGFERDPEIPLAQPSIMLVTGAPQQGMPGSAVGYEVSEGGSTNTFVVTPTSADGLPAEKLFPPAPGAKEDPIGQRGIKVVHVGLKSAFINRGERGRVAVRFLDSDGNAVDEGTGEIAFLDAPRPQIFPTNFPHAQRNHNWQRIAPGQTVGQEDGTVPLTLMLYEADTTNERKGIVGAGVLSTQQLAAMEFEKPTALERYNGGLILRDTDGNGRLDPKSDQIIGGVIGSAPAGATGQELKSLMRDGVADLSRPTAAFNPGAGGRFGGAIMLLEFTAGDKVGAYRPTLALLTDPDDPTSADGASYTYTILAE